MNDESIELRSVLADPALAGVYVVEASGLSVSPTGQHLGTAAVHV